MDLLLQLLDIKLLTIWGPLLGIAVIEGFALYKLFKIYQKLNDDRHTEALDAQRNLSELIQKTHTILETLISTLRGQ